MEIRNAKKIAPLLVNLTFTSEEQDFPLLSGGFLDDLDYSGISGKGKWEKTYLLYPFPSLSNVRRILEIIIKPFHLNPLQASCYFLDLLKIPGHTFYEIGVNLQAANSVYFLKSEDTDGQLAAEHHSAQLRPVAQKFFL